jgi:glycosyltransferase involved in cell wall biosynthesis
MKIAFACPALNEEALLRRTVERTLHMMDFLVIVDDGSTDRTGEIAEELKREHPDKIEVIHHVKNKGIGGAVKSAFRLLLEREGMDAMGVIASDNQCEPALVERFREVLETMPEVDVAKGSRFMHPESLHEMPAFRRWGNRGVSTVLQLALGFWGMDDVLHGYFLARTDLMRQMNLDAVADGYDLENTMMAEFRRLRASFALVPSPSHYGEAISKIVYRTQIPRTIATVSSMVARRAVQGPDRLGLALLLMSVPTLGTTLPLALLRMKRTSPKVKKLR